MSQRAKVFMLILLGVLVAGGFYLRGLARRVFFEPPRQAEEAERTRLKEIALQSPTGTGQTATLYFPAYDQGTLRGENRTMTWARTDSDRIRQVLLALIEGSRQGNSPALPPSTSIRAVYLTSEGTTYLDFSNELIADFTPGIQSESLTVYAIVNSLAANIPAVKKVKIVIQGQEVDSLNGHADLSDYFVPEPALNAPAS